MIPQDARQAVSVALTRFLDDEDQWTMSLSGTHAVRRLENKFSTLIGHPYALGVSSATMGLWATFHVLDIHDADVIAPPYTWGGSLAGLLLAGNRPVFTDIDPDFLVLDPLSIERQITGETRAILAVDIYGHPSFGEVLRWIADEHRLFLIQDCAQSFGAFVGDHHTGWWADAAVFSLGPGKDLYGGEGGVVVTRHKNLYERLVRATQHPRRQTRDLPTRPSSELGVNLRVHPAAAVIADATFDHALSAVACRRARSFRILEFLKEQNLSATRLPLEEAVKPSFHVATFQPCAGVDARAVEQRLEAAGLPYRVESPPIVKPIHRQVSFRQHARLKGWEKQRGCPVAEKQCIQRLRLVDAFHRKGAGTTA